MGRQLNVGWIAAAVLALCSPAFASGDGSPAPWYLDQFGGEKVDQDAFYDGRVGIVMARAPRPRLLAAWRMLHGLSVGREAGDTLSIPCCNGPLRFGVSEQPTPIEAWIAARKAVPGAPQVEAKDLAIERAGPDFTSVPNCYDDAFTTAGSTLADRVRRYGAKSPDVLLWLRTQDAVFQSCSEPNVALPPLRSGTPDWVKADRAYQEAALDFYDGRLDQAAALFGAIAADHNSPWHPWGLYLKARALERYALQHRSPEAGAAARQAIEQLADGPPDSIGKGAVLSLSSILEFRYDPARMTEQIERQLRQSQPPKDIAILFRDYSDLTDQAPVKPEIADWMATLLPQPKIKGIAYDATPEQRNAQAKIALALYRETRRGALLHARDRWKTTHDPAWLIAALSLVDPNEAEAKSLVVGGREVRPDYPGWIAIQYHLIRIAIAAGDAAAVRAPLDAILARKTLSMSDRNVFMGQRLQVATDLQDFARHAVRHRLCANEFPGNGACSREDWEADVQVGVFDRDDGKGLNGLGEDARATIDRLPLAERMALSRDSALPEKLRMDIALTNFPRAVQLSDDAAIDALARQLEPMLPQLAAEWRRIPLAKPGPDKRFASFMVLAKIPGLRSDLLDYVRPVGRVSQFQTHWMDWIVLARGKGLPALGPPALGRYQMTGYLPEAQVDPTTFWRAPTNDARSDLTCLGECGRGGAPLRPPPFAVQLQARARAERAYFVQMQDTEEPAYDYATHKPIAPSPPPPGSVAVWDEMLAYAETHPQDSRIPEALHFIVHASHFGASHNHSGRRAFRLLQRRYPHTIWARQTRSYSE